MHDWEAKMAAQGHFSLVRKKSQHLEKDKNKKNAVKQKVTVCEDPPF